VRVSARPQIGTLREENALTSDDVIEENTRDVVIPPKSRDRNPQPRESRLVLPGEFHDQGDNVKN
jgi:hypothetical protein